MPPCGLTHRRLPVSNASFACLPTTPVRHWPSSRGAVASAVVLLVSARRVLDQLNATFATWDRLLLAQASGAWLVLQTDPLRVPPSDVAHALQLRPAGCDLPEALLRAGVYLPFETPQGNKVLLLSRGLRPAVPPIYGSTVDEAAGAVPWTCMGVHAGEYMVGTKWYVHALLALEALDYFDFFFKVDADVTVHRPGLLETMQTAMVRERSPFAHTASVRNKMEGYCALTLRDCASDYARVANCATLEWEDARSAPASVCSSSRLGSILSGCTYFHSNFMAVWLGLFQSPQLLQFASFWHAWPPGWHNRWTDQQFWPVALWVTDSEHAVLDKSTWRAQRHFVHSSAAKALVKERVANLPSKMLADAERLSVARTAEEEQRTRRWEQDVVSRCSAYGANASKCVARAYARKRRAAGNRTSVGSRKAKGHPRRLSRVWPRVH